jgi:hypothetical protein
VMRLWRRFMAWLDADDIARMLDSADVISREQEHLRATYERYAKAHRERCGRG